MHYRFYPLVTVLLIGLSVTGCEHKKTSTYVYEDSLFVRDSMNVYAAAFHAGTFSDNDTARNPQHPEYLTELKYLTELNEQIQLNKIKLLVPVEKYYTLENYLRKLPVLAITGRQFRNEQTGDDMPGCFEEGRFINSHTAAVVISFGEYLNHCDDKYKYEVIDTMPKGYASVGMTKSMIKKALGEPENIITGNLQDRCLEQWTYENIYKFDGTIKKLKERKFIYFIDDRAVSIKG